MKRNLKNILLIIIVIGSIVFAGCGVLGTKDKDIGGPLKPDNEIEENSQEGQEDKVQENEDQEEGPEEPLDPTDNNLDTKYISQEETIYEFVKIPETEEEEKNPKLIHYLTEDHPELIKVKEVAEEFSRLWSEAHYETHNGDEWFHLYHQNALEEAIETGEAEESREFVKQYKLINSFLDIEFELIQLAEDFNTALVQAKIVERIDNCTKDLEAEYSLKQGDEFRDTVRYLLWTENGVWKVVAKEIFGREILN